jgi:hypothetical protein
MDTRRSVAPAAGLTVITAIPTTDKVGDNCVAAA